MLSLVIASPFGSVILSVSEESRFSGQAPAKQSRFNARDKLRNLDFQLIKNLEIASLLALLAMTAKRGLF